MNRKVKKIIIISILVIIMPTVAVLAASKDGMWNGTNIKTNEKVWNKNSFATQNDIDYIEKAMIYARDYGTDRFAWINSEPRDENNPVWELGGEINNKGISCIGHRLAGNEGACTIKVFDMYPNTTNSTWQTLAILIANFVKDINRLEGKVVQWCYDNTESLGILKQGEYNEQGQTAISYESESEEGKKLAVNIFESTSKKDGKQNIVEKNGNTFIGPYNLTIKGGTISNITITNEDGKTISAGPGDNKIYVSIDGGKTISKMNKIKEKSEWDYTNYSGDSFYVVYKGKLDDVKEIKITREKSGYRSRLVVVEAQGTTGQNLILFDGAPQSETTNLYLPGVPYGTLQIKKIDNDTGKTLTGIGFKVYSQTKKAWLKLDSDNSIAEYTTFDQATVIYTKEKGETAKIEQMPVGKYDIYETYLGPYDNIYELEEINVPGEDEKVKAKLIEKDYQISGTKILECKNEQVYVSLSGYVWVDNISGKQSTIDNIYKDKDSDDMLLDGITVRLKERIIGATGTTETIGKTIKEAITANGGKYLFTHVLVDDLDKYYIEFEYDGLTYSNVVPKINKDNGSKAKESTNDRETYNEGFSIITGSEAEDTDDKTYGTTKIAEDSGTKYELEYEKKEHEAIFEKVTEEPKIVAATKNTDYKISDNFKKGTGQVLIENINLGLYEREQPNIAVVQDIENVKLSINGYNHVYKYASRNKEENQKKYINQYYNEIYKDRNIKRYSSEKTEDGKIDYIEDNNGDYVLVDGEYIHMNIFNVGVRYKTKYSEESYTRAIYQSDYNYFESDSKSNKLDVNITYKIRMINESTGLNVCVNSLVDYYDSRYNVVNVGTKLDEQGNIDEGSYLDYAPEETNYVGYKKMIINTGYKDKTQDEKAIIETQKEKEIYVQFELTENAKLNILNNTENLNNVAEIYSYSVFDAKDGTLYAGIDENSNPGNAEPGIFSTYEDDTDQAPGILLKVMLSRKMTGTVFFDESTGGVGLVRQGDGIGIYDEAKEKGIAGVKVTLTETSGTGLVYTDTTKENGEFLIENYIPGDYTLTYTWGDETYTVQDYKGTIYKDKDRATNNPEWYKVTEPRYSDALDDYKIRRIIDVVEDMNADGRIDEEEAIKYKEKLQEKYAMSTEFTDEEKLQLDLNGDGVVNINDAKIIDTYKTRLATMESKTPIMGIGIEEETNGTTKFGITSIETEVNGDQYIPKGFNIVNIDFGIVERARQELIVDKKIRSIKITLANGQTIVDGQVIQGEDGTLRLSHDQNIVTGMAASETSYPRNGYLKAEIDSELLQGSTLEIQYVISLANNSELDYDSEQYYLYGEKGDNDKVINYIASGIYDYLDNTLTLAEDRDSKWETKTISEYNSSVTEPTIIEDYLYKYSSISTDSEGNVIEYTGYESFKEQYQVENWNMETIEQARMKRLADKTILYNGDIEDIAKSVIPGKTIELATLNASKVLSNSQEINLNNDAEITKVNRTTRTGRRLKINSVYDSGETVTVTTPTGESKNYVPSITIFITLLITLGTGIVFIKKKILT